MKFISINSDGKVSGFEEHPEVDVQSGVWIKEGSGKECVVGWRSEKIGNNEWRNSLRKVQK